jgi:hypothetical protein
MNKLIGIFANAVDEKLLVKRYGPELVVNGFFSSDAFWVKGLGWTISGGTLNDVALAGTSTYQGIAAVTGRRYLITLDIPFYGGGDLLIFIGTSGGGFIFVIGAGAYSKEVTANGNDIILYNGVGCNIKIDNVSVREVLKIEEDA